MDKAIYEFYKSVDRSLFLQDNIKSQAKYDYPLPIGFDQTTSQPSLILDMVSLLKLNKNCTVLEIGTGSGYQTAFLAKFSKHVYTVDIYSTFTNKAKSVLKSLGFCNITFAIKDASDGWPEKGPFDRIIVSCAPSVIPNSLIEQLSVGGIMVLPVGVAYNQTLMKVTKKDDGSIKIKSYYPVVFVEFKGKYGW